MPLYELVTVARCGEARFSRDLVRNVSAIILQRGGVVREVRCLGDRILSKALKGSDHKWHNVGRYISIQFDGNPDTLQAAQIESRASYEYLRCWTGRVKDTEYVNSVYQKLARQMNPSTDPEVRNTKFIKEMWKYAQASKMSGRTLANPRGGKF
mmetsp:Transcript_51588/g.59001  ORF Transcript_51588/g.59001 Transcript_51588/m.59001 type:complete len:154 (+) Transcript_51588:42-503(+)|eukprot:CAMPEP_0114983572 /NCGR_PEP_ID=MMETSP0216-20121206/6775_1 /TAXON_ID=223996 /ORGANISM="Protocruzia adherens, Strain Boccale" /LENGTH=153 /DNA_ID=CAMNT_0002345571 /DNA_START=33 /DNA_END=494 /DNA_ORIENTATION=-